VCRRECAREIDADRERNLRRKPRPLRGHALLHGFEVLAVDELRGDEVAAAHLAEVRHLDDVRVRERREQTRFLDEHVDEVPPGGELLQENFQREDLAELRRAAQHGLPDVRHVTVPERSEQRVATENVGHPYCCTTQRIRREIAACYNRILSRTPHSGNGTDAVRGIPDAVVDRRGERIDLDPIRRLLESIVRRWNPHEIWLFGSRARGEATPESDWDLLVIVPDDVTSEDRDPMEIYRAKTGMGVPSDVVLFTRAEFIDDRDTTNTLPYEVSIRGVRVYER